MLVMACGDSPEILEPAEPAFDEVAVFLGLGVVSVAIPRRGAEVDVVRTLVRGLEESSG